MKFNLFRRDRRHTKKSCLGNAIVAFVLAVVMVLCIFLGQNHTSEAVQGLMVATGLLLAVTVYWIYRYINFDTKNFDDPFHLRD